MPSLMRHIIPRRFTCLLCGGACCATNCQLYTSGFEYIKGYLGCPSRMTEK